MKHHGLIGTSFGGAPGAVALSVPPPVAPLAGVAAAGYDLLRMACVSMALLVTLATSILGVRGWLEQRTASAGPWVPSVAIDEIFIDNTTIWVTVAAGAEAAPWATTRDDLIGSRTMWQRMRLADWNAVPDTTRRAALDRILAMYRDVIWTPAVWDAMTADAWDHVPQPVRIVAYRHMVAYWAGFYAVGKSYGIPPATVSDTLSAMVMSESWFDHRAVAVSRSGNRDLGLAQASDFARARMRTLYGAGRVDTLLLDADYFNPWRATQFLAIWMSLLLDEADGDLARAVRAYHRGINAADDERGLWYDALVQRRLRTFIRNDGAPPAWTYWWERARESGSVAWPWVYGSDTTWLPAAHPG